MDLAGYHGWANARLVETLLQLPEERWRQEVNASFPTLDILFRHVLQAERIWLRRLQLAEAPEQLDEALTFPELGSQLLAHNRALEEWIASRPEPYFEHVIAYYDLKKRHFKVPVYQVLLQQFHHGTYHRGQAVVMLRELGETRLPGTDYIHYKRQ